MKNKPNIILINCDDLGYGDLGCYGSQVHNTPVLDSMAQNGLRFTSFYMASPVCSPSRGAMMTGCYPKRIGFGSFDGRLVLFPGRQGVGINPDEVTVAETLKNVGYSTMLIGKWHCGDQPEFLPTRHGFDYYYGLPYSNDMGRQLNRPDSPPLPLMVDEDVIQEQPDLASLTERYVEQAVRFIRTNKENPLFLYFAHMYVHLPLMVPSRFMKQSKNGAYGAAVECIDWATGVILDELRRQGLDRNTLVVFTSDNGSRNDFGNSNGPLRGGKNTTWEGGQRLPYIMYWPGTIKEGVVCDEIVTSMDFMPTFTLLAEGSVPNDRIIDGKDIRPLMFSESGDNARSPHEAFYYYSGNNLEAVREGKWKLHVRKKTSVIRELYNLDNDIGETVNLYEQHSDIVARLEKLLDKCREDLGDDAAGITGANCRAIGRVENPVPLAVYNPDHPYIDAMYDTKDGG